MLRQHINQCVCSTGTNYTSYAKMHLVHFIKIIVVLTLTRIKFIESGDIHDGIEVAKDFIGGLTEALNSVEIDASADIARSFGKFFSASSKILGGKYYLFILQ